MRHAFHPLSVVAGMEGLSSADMDIVINPKKLEGKARHKNEEFSEIHYPFEQTCYHHRYRTPCRGQDSIDTQDRSSYTPPVKKQYLIQLNSIHSMPPVYGPLGDAGGAFSPGLCGSHAAAFGLAQYKPQEDMKAFVHRVDQLMYQAKKNGKDRVCSIPSIAPNKPGAVACGKRDAGR